MLHRSATFNLPFDLGANLIHLPAQSSLATLAAKQGSELYPDPAREQVRVRDRNGVEKDLEELHSKLRLEDFYANSVRCNAAIAQAAADKGDISCAEALPADFSLLATDYGIRTGALSNRRRVKELSAKEYINSVDRGPGWLCRQGAGAFIGRLALGVPIKFFSPVTMVDWSERSVTLAMGDDVVTARAAIMTASTAVLASGKIEFRPHLPARYTSALEKLKLGSYDYVAFAFKDNALELNANEVVFEKAFTANMAALFANVNGTRLSLLTLAGRTGAELADKDESAMTEFALDWISGIFGLRAKQAVSRMKATSWKKDPWILGAFSSGPPGAQEARKALAEPLNDALWFAGEAVNQNFWGTVGGAWQDGERAANAVIAQLDRSRAKVKAGKTRTSLIKPAFCPVHD